MNILWDGAVDTPTGTYGTPPRVTILKNDKAKFKAALRKYLHTHTHTYTHTHTHTHTHIVYPADEFFVCKDGV